MELIELVKKNPNLRKIFGKRELIIMQKQLLGIRLTQSERNRLSRDVRKKLEVIKTLSQFSSEFGLKHGAEVKNRVEEVKQIILKSSYFHKIKKIVLFGSTVDNTRTFKSDIDISVEFFNIDVKGA